MFRSKELITLIDKFGHCESYTFCLELEIAIAKAVQENAALLLESIIRNPVGKSIFHLEFDDFDMFVNELYGAGFVHTSHGIMLQGVGSENVAREKTCTVPKAKERSLQTLCDDNLPDHYMAMRKCPMMNTDRERYEEGI